MWGNTNPMATEIERKFLVKEEMLPKADKIIRMSQAYLQTEPERTIRVRVTDESAFLTIKGKQVGFSRAEFEYPIPKADAEELMKLACYPPIEKDRHLIVYKGKTWEVDFFKGANKGLILAEVELADEQEQVELPNWLAVEVTGEERYHNSYLARYPFSAQK